MRIDGQDGSLIITAEPVVPKQLRKANCQADCYYLELRGANIPQTSMNGKAVVHHDGGIFHLACRHHKELTEKEHSCDRWRMAA